MSTKKIVGIVLLVVGIIVLILALSADVIGIGGNHDIGFKQILGAVVAAVVAVVGLILTRRK